MSVIEGILNAHENLLGSVRSPCRAFRGRRNSSRRAYTPARRLQGFCGSARVIGRSALNTGGSNKNEHTAQDFPLGDWSFGGRLASKPLSA